MTFQAGATIVYGLLIAGGGVAGFVAAKSLPSLISGGLLGLVALAGGLLMAMGHPVGFWFAVAAAALTGAFFGVKAEPCPALRSAPSSPGRFQSAGARGGLCRGGAPRREPPSP